MNRVGLDLVAADRESALARAYPWVASGLLVWLLVWVVISWPYSLDDALIHLRYADHLLHQHRITYDGVHASFGTSSLLYVSLLAGLRAFSTSPLLPRTLSTITYLLLFVCLALELYRSLRRHGAQPAALWLLSVALLSVMVAPSAVRWLDDGMETGLVFLDTFAAVLIARQLVRPVRLSRRVLLAAFSFGFFTVLLRVELLLLVVCVAAMAGLELVTGRERRQAVEHPGRVVLAVLAPLTGALAAVALVLLTMHALLPDTALAKAFGAREWRDTLVMTLSTVGSSFSFGIGLLVLWLLSVAVLVSWTGVAWADLVGNLLFPAVLLAAASRGQHVQGIRYFGWTLFFPLLWNLLRLSESSPLPESRSAARLGFVLVLFLVGLLPAFVWESGTFFRLFADRDAALNTFRSQPQLAALKGQLGIAEDVGFVGYFTQGDICDPYGLINGREAAKSNYVARFVHCMAQGPVFAFGSQEFLKKVARERPLGDWTVCGEYPFDNVSTRDVHYLVVAPATATSACVASSSPVRKVLPGIL